MFGLNDAYLNAVKKQAKNLNDIYQNLTAAERKDDKFVIQLISDMHKPVETIINRDRFVWVAGYLKGRVGRNHSGDSMYE